MRHELFAGISSTVSDQKGQKFFDRIQGARALWTRLDYNVLTLSVAWIWLHLSININTKQKRNRSAWKFDSLDADSAKACRLVSDKLLKDKRTTLATHNVSGVDKILL